MIMTIKEPFEVAWKIFSWGKKEPGIGLSKEVIDRSNDTVEIDVNRTGDKFVGNAKEIKEYCNKNNYLYSLKSGTKLYVVPQSFLKRIYEYKKTDKRIAW